MEENKNDANKQGQQQPAETSSEKTVTGLTQNVEALLCYILGWITGLLFLILNKDNKFVRFHAIQSLTTFLGLFVIGFVGGMIPLLGPLISFLIAPVGLILWILLMYKAYQGERYKLPIVGDFTEEQMSRMETK